MAAEALLSLAWAAGFGVVSVAASRWVAPKLVEAAVTAALAASVVVGAVDAMASFGLEAFDAALAVRVAALAAPGEAAADAGVVGALVWVLVWACRIELRLVCV
jgi:hypothetical protein